jgi:hypothetical protein
LGGTCCGILSTRQRRGIIFYLRLPNELSSCSEVKGLPASALNLMQARFPFFGACLNFVVFKMNLTCYIQDDYIVLNQDE